MTEILLLRHGAADHLGRGLAGRAPGLHLNAAGREQAAALADLLADAALAAVYTSPLERSRETAAPIAARHGVEVRVSGSFDEVDFGDWTGLSFDVLDGREDWRRWNERRGSARPPGGESMDDVVARATAGLDELTERHPHGRVVVVSHCDVIRPLLARALGFPLDHCLRLAIDPASVSVLEVSRWGSRVLVVNRTLWPPWSAR